MSDNQISGAAEILKDIQGGAIALALGGEARKVVAQSTGVRPSIDTLFRWTTRGVRGSDGARVLLARAKMPRGFATTEPAIRRFFEKLNSAEGIIKKQEDASQADRDATRRLAAAGF